MGMGMEEMLLRCAFRPNTWPHDAIDCLLYSKVTNTTSHSWKNLDYPQML